MATRIKYLGLDDQMHRAEVWSKGPLHATLWCLREPDDYPVVVSIAKGEYKEREYETPVMPPPLPPEALKKVLEIRHKHVQAQKHLGPRKPFEWIRPVEEDDQPTEAEVNAAQTLFDIDVSRREAIDLFRAAHHAPVTLSDKRFAEIARADE